MGIVTKEGEVFTWGYNDYGQLGWGISGENRTGQQKPNKVSMPWSTEGSLETINDKCMNLILVGVPVSTEACMGLCVPHLIY
jgi:alpha-tubulin suppressor-like RCC1 family protein